MRRTVLLLTGITLLGACGEQTATEPSANVQARVSPNTTSSADVQKDLATLRRVTAPFHRFQAAVAAGWSAKITACMTSPAGGMGFHYGNPGYIDGSVRVDQPELLLYEPEKNGDLRLVAVEYIIPYTLHSRDAAPPTLFGQNFRQNDTFQLWGLHAWVWQHNPSGMFADWNPTVTCANTADVSAM